MGEDHAYPMVAYGTMQKSAAWKLYAKSQDIPFALANAVSDQIRKYETAVKHAGEDEKDDINVYDYIDKEYHDIYAKSKDYLGLVTSWSIAPCSYLLYGGSIRNEIGLVKVKDHLCCIMDGHWAEDCHFLKNDLLKVSVVDLIYRSYQRIGMEPPTVTELLRMCPPDDLAWTIYEKGCTLGINQCEQTGTASRVAVYKPKNISELGAFVAAIRPGFKSMYKKFESREPFAYGVKAFDELIQTDEMPNSFLLYQEQEMAALNYAGIDMSECYTAIKNIAKKRVEKVLAYKEKFIDGFKSVMINDEHKTEQEAETLSQGLWQIIEDSSRYSFNASHSYCVAMDSLYGAWLKAHHPLEFYEVALRVAEEKGDKDKMFALKAEAEEYFGIKFPPFRFGQDNSVIKADTESNSISNTIAALKGYNSTVGATLYETSKLKLTSFIDVLRTLDERGLKTAKVRPLILVDYFEQYGTIKQLDTLQQAWDFLKQGDAKVIRKDKILLPRLDRIIEKLAVNTTETSFRVDGKIMDILYDYEKLVLRLLQSDYTLKEKLQFSMDILGYADVVTHKECDRKRLLITDVAQLNDKSGNPWAFRIGTRSLGSGKSARVTIRAKTFLVTPLKIGNIILAIELWKNPQGYWYLMDYRKED